MRGPHTQPPASMDLPQGPPVPAVPSAPGHHLHPARGVLASAHATPGRECPAPSRPLPRAARDLQAPLVRSATSTARLSPPKAGAGTPHPTSQVPPAQVSSPPRSKRASKKLLRCLLWDQRIPPSQLDPGEKQRWWEVWEKRGAAHCPALQMRPQPRGPVHGPPGAACHIPQGAHPHQLTIPFTPFPPTLPTGHSPSHTPIPPGDHKDPQGQGLHAHLPSAWGQVPTGPSSLSKCTGEGTHTSETR